jgi:ADP-ribose pyrophosphatase
MVDPGEHVSLTARRETMEETGVDLGEVEGVVIYEGYVDDPRNTRNAWMETSARLFVVDHAAQPRPDGNEVIEVAWFDCSSPETLLAATQQYDRDRGLPEQPLYASHSDIIGKALESAR